MQTLSSLHIIHWVLFLPTGKCSTQCLSFHTGTNMAISGVVWISDVEQNAIIWKACRKTVATKGSRAKYLFQRLKSHALQHEECFKLSTWTSHQRNQLWNQLQQLSARETSQYVWIHVIVGRRVKLQLGPFTHWGSRHIAIYIMYQDIAK